MFVTLTRINQEGHEKELVVDTTEIAFITQAEDHICYDKPTKFEPIVNENGDKTYEPIEWETEERFVIAFKNGRHPQFLDRANYETLKKILTK